MLVCNVSMRPPRRAIAAELAEIATALDASTTGQVVFATLVDDPASVLDHVDAYLGEIMLEAASAADTTDAGLVYAASLDETTTAGDVQDATMAGAVTQDARTLAASRAGLGSMVVSDDGSGKTRIIPDIGAVT